MLQLLKSKKNCQIGVKKQQIINIIFLVKETFMKLLKTTKTLLLSGALLFGAFDVLEAAPKPNKAEAKYQALLGAGNYTELNKFLGSMSKRMQTQLNKAKDELAELQEDELADEEELDAAKGDITIKQNALRFWQERAKAVAELEASSVENEKRIKQMAQILPGLRAKIEAAVNERHEYNAAALELKQLLDEHEEYLKSVKAFDGIIPTISFQKHDAEVETDAQLRKLEKAVEAELNALKVKKDADEKSQRAAADSVERDSNTKKKKRGKKKAAAETVE